MALLAASYSGSFKAQNRCFPECGFVNGLGARGPGGRFSKLTAMESCRLQGLVPLEREDGEPELGHNDIMRPRSYTGMTEDLEVCP